MIKIGSNKIGTRRKCSVPRCLASPRRYLLSVTKSRKYVKLRDYVGD